jgi:hypothetical protein
MSIDWATFAPVATAIIGAVLGFGGALLAGNIGANAVRAAARTGAEQVEADREARRVAQLAEHIQGLASEILARSERYRHEVRVQVRVWGRAAAGQVSAESIPDVHSCDEVLDLVGRLYIVGRQDTADAAWGLYLQLRDGLGWFVYVAERDRKGDKVSPRTHEEVTGLALVDAEYQRRKTAFLDRVRIELGLPALAQGVQVFAASEDNEPPASFVVPSVAHIDGNSYTTPPG